MKKHLLYLRYLIRHKAYVFLAGFHMTRAPLWRLIIHDWSKFLPCEWRPYVEKFYGSLAGGVNSCGNPLCKTCKVREREYYAALAVVDKAFDRAWLHHQHANAHHWQHWVLLNDSAAVQLLEMPEPLIREMVADWVGAGWAITGKIDIHSWYAKNREIISLAPKTRARVDELIAKVPK